MISENYLFVRLGAFLEIEGMITGSSSGTSVIYFPRVVVLIDNVFLRTL